MLLQKGGIIMPSQQAVQLSQVIRQKVDEMKKLCAGLDEKTASRAPSGRWSPKQILSHICGPDGVGLIPAIKTILEQDTPRLDLDPGNPFFTERRSKMTVAELLKEFEGEYDRLAGLVAGLSDGQLARKAHVPALKETPMGEHLTLAVWVSALAERHIGFHIDHMREILQELAATPR
jgi:DinB superfamily